MTAEATQETPWIKPDEIDFEFRPRRQAGVAEVEVGGDLVLVAGAFTAGVVLNRTAELVWRCLDGESTIAKVVAVLDEATGAGAETIRADVLETVRAFGRAALLEGVVQHTHRREGSETSLTVGQPVELFTLPGLDGRPITVGAPSERQVLLVNWSPHCGYCVEVTAELVGLGPQLEARGVDLVFLTRGDLQANRDVFGSDNQITALLRPPEDEDDDSDGADGRKRFPDPFGGLGTPAAYLLAADGTIAEPLAYGAAEVPVLARRLAGVEARIREAPEDGHSEAAAPNEIRYLAAQSAACAAGAGEVSPVWADRRVLGVGNHHVGVECNTVEAATLLDRLLPGVLVDDDRAPVNYSLVLQGAAERGARALNLLVRGGEHLVRSRSPARVLQALLFHVVSQVRPADPALLRVGSLAAVRNGRAVLLPVDMKGALKALQPHLFRLGLQLVDVPWASVDTGSKELVVPEPGIGHDQSVLDELDRDVRLGAELTSVNPGRYPIDVWYVLGLPDGVGPTGPALALSCVAGLIDASTDLQVRVEALADLLATVPVHRLWWESHAELRAQLAAGLPG